MIRLAVTVGILAVATAAAAQDTKPALPGGASSLRETHGDWTVQCVVADAGKQCTLSQSVGDQDGRQVVALDLGVRDGNKAEGVLLTAFGLRLDAGVQLGIDGAALNSALPFFTCVMSGCVVPVTLDEVALSALQVGSVLEVTAVSADSAAAVTVPISLTGFTAAYNRTAELSH